MIVLGLTGGFHQGSCDATAAIVRDGVLVAAVEEERLTRMKHSFAIPPQRSIKACLDIAQLSIHEIDRVAIYTESYAEAAREMEVHIASLFGTCPPVEPVHHHLTHAASTYYASGFEESAVVVYDWSGDGVSSSIWKGSGGRLEKIEFIERPNSLGVFYAAFTQFLGFERGDEYKVMGLAGYGTPRFDLGEFLDTSGEVYRVNPDIFEPRTRSMHQVVFGDALRNWQPELKRTRYAPLTQAHRDLAASVQYAFERAALGLARRALRLAQSRNLCIAGGGGLNSKANGMLANGIADAVFVPPFPNDSGCAYGAAAAVSARLGCRPKPMTTAQLGPQYSDQEIGLDLELLKIAATKETNVAEIAADAIADGKLVGWFQGPLEIGPRALGGRSILADPRDRTVKDRINKYVKFREDFRPLAPSVLEPSTSKYFKFGQSSPYMSFVGDVLTPDELPGITHVDGTARLHTVKDDGSPYAELLKALEIKTGYPVVLNTSFNYMGQPIVCTPKEAIYTFFGTGLDLLVAGNWVVRK